MILVREERDWRVLRSEKMLQELSYSIRQENLRKMGTPRLSGSLFKEIILENFPKLGRQLDMYVHTAKKNTFPPQCKKTFTNIPYNETVKSQ